MIEPRPIKLRVNDEQHEAMVEPRKLLSDFLREDVNLSGVHIGCEHGNCGACTIIFNGELVRSCLTLAVQADGAEIMTVEGLASDGKLHPIQEAFYENHGAQCGFCTPGQVLMAYSLLCKNPKPTEDEIREAMSGHLCRCTGYYSIVESIKAAAEKLDEKRT
jgi:carbon-monoxide dehydrogenase small subunit